MSDIFDKLEYSPPKKLSPGKSARVKRDIFDELEYEPSAPSPSVGALEQEPVSPPPAPIALPAQDRPPLSGGVSMWQALDDGAKGLLNAFDPSGADKAIAARQQQQQISNPWMAARAKEAAMAQGLAGLTDNVVNFPLGLAQQALDIPEENRFSLDLEGQTKELISKLPIYGDLAKQAPDFMDQYGDTFANVGPVPFLGPGAMAKRLPFLNKIPGVSKLSEGLAAGSPKAALLDNALAGAIWNPLQAGGEEFKREKRIDPANIGIQAGIGFGLGGAIGSIPLIAGRAASKAKDLLRKRTVPAPQALSNVRRLADDYVNLEAIDSGEQAAYLAMKLPKGERPPYPDIDWELPAPPEFPPGQAVSEAPATTYENPFRKIRSGDLEKLDEVLLEMFSNTDPRHFKQLRNDAAVAIRKHVADKDIRDEYRSMVKAEYERVKTQKPAEPQPESPEKLTGEVREDVDPELPTPEPDSVPSSSVIEGAFRINRDKRLGHNIKSANLEDLPIDLSQLTSQGNTLEEAIYEIAGLKAEQALLEKQRDQLIDATLRKFAPGKEETEVVGFPIRRNLKKRLPPELQNALDLVKAEAVAKGDAAVKEVGDVIVRATADSTFGQGKNAADIPPPVVSDDPIEAGEQIAELHFKLVGSKARGKDAIQIAGLKNQYSAARDKYRQDILRAEDQLKEALGRADAQFQARVTVPHPLGKQYGSIDVTVETAKPQQITKWTNPEAEKAYKDFESTALLKEGITEENFLQAYHQADAAMSNRDAGELAPMNQLREQAAKLLNWKHKAFDVEPGASPSKMDKAAKQVILGRLATSKYSLAALGGLITMADQEAYAADGNNTKAKGLSTAQTVGLALIGLGLGHTAIKNGGKLLDPKALGQVANLWRDTVDHAWELDKKLGTTFEKDIKRAWAATTMKSWGVKWDNLELRQAGVEALRKGMSLPSTSPQKLTLQDALAGKAGTAFEYMTPAQRESIVEHYVIKKTLFKQLNEQVTSIRERIANQSLTDSPDIQSGLEAMDYVLQELTGRNSKDNAVGRAVKGALSNAMDAFFFWNPEHHILNLSDQWIAGGSRIGVVSIARANQLLTTDSVLKAAFKNSNLVGGFTSDRLDLKALANSGKPIKRPGRELKDLPSDIFNADRVGLASLLQFANLNKARIPYADVDFARKVLDPKSQIDDAIRLEAIMHMSDQLSRTLGVDPFKINTNIITRSAVGKTIGTFVNQPARISRLFLESVATGNMYGVVMIPAVTLALGGRAAIPKDLGDTLKNTAPELYFKSAYLFDEAPITNIPLKTTRALIPGGGQNPANKLEWSALGYPLMMAQNPAAQIMFGLANKTGDATEALAHLAEASKSKDKKLIGNAQAEVNTAMLRVATDLATIAKPRILGAPAGLINRSMRAGTIQENGAYPVSFYEPGDARPFLKKTEIDLKKNRQLISPAIGILDPLIPGKPELADKLYMDKLESEKGVPKKRKSFVVEKKIRK